MNTNLTRNKELLTFFGEVQLKGERQCADVEKPKTLKATSLT